MNVERQNKDVYICIKNPMAREANKMAKKHASGLDGRQRDLDGEIRHKRGNTLVGTLRETYGRDFAQGYRSDTKLSTLLERTGSRSLSEYLLSATSKRFEPALKSLAKK
jgi:hypothetical protein